MNVLDTSKRAQILHCLVEGCSMRSTARLTGTTKKAVARLLVLAGTACADYMDEHLRGLSCKVLQLDEIWAFIGCKEARVRPHLKGMGTRGDVWTWMAIDADTELIPAWYVGNRGMQAAYDFISDLKSRLANRVQLTTDGYHTYIRTIPDEFGADKVDYAILQKTFGHVLTNEARYSPPQCTGTRKMALYGNPDPQHISTSFIERANLTMRMGNRRFTRLTNAFSKKFENHVHAIALHFMHYNYCRVHTSLRVTPAMAAGMADHVWDLSEVVGLLAAKPAP
jgi:IS1 family transposase